MENHDNGGSFTIKTRHSIIGERLCSPSKQSTSLYRVMAFSSDWGKMTLSLEFVKIVNL